MRPRLVLASQSPRRRELLEQLGLAVDIRPANADEAVLPGEAARDYVLRVARQKARAVEGDLEQVPKPERSYAHGSRDQPLVLAADTAVVLRGEVLGKPTDPDDASRMLHALSGASHEVLTAVCVRRRGEAIPAELHTVVTTSVRFARLSNAQIDWYVATGEPLDKAGAYGIQGAAGAFVERIEGSVSNVVGLPLPETTALLARMGLPLPWDEAAPRRGRRTRAR